MALDGWVVAGLDSGGTTINATLQDGDGRFLVACPQGQHGR
jgi:hypothetical protein